jgi:hypothetical protein
MTGGTVTDAIKTIREFYNSEQYKNAIEYLKSADDFDDGLKTVVATLNPGKDYKAEVATLATINKDELKTYADTQIDKGKEESETAKSFSVLMIAVTLADIYNIFKTLDAAVALPAAADDGAADDGAAAADDGAADRVDGADGADGADGPRVPRGTRGTQLRSLPPPLRSLPPPLPRPP